MSRINLADLDLDHGHMTLIDAVKDVISRFEDQEFTTLHIEAAVKKHHPRHRNSTTINDTARKVVSKMAQEGLLAKVGGTRIKNYAKLYRNVRVDE